MTTSCSSSANTRSRAVRTAFLALLALSVSALCVTPVAAAHENLVRPSIWNFARHERAGGALGLFERRSLIAASAARLERPMSTLKWSAGAWQAVDPEVTAEVGGNPVGELIDQRTHTLYVANGNTNNVSVINTLTCNALQTAGCDQNAPTVAAGTGPLAFALDPAKDTLYVADLGSDTVSMIDTATCNASNHAGCGQVAPQVTVGSGPTLLALDTATDTVYVPDVNGDTVSMFDASTCNATDTKGCTVSSVTVGSGPNAVAINPSTHTAYAANFNDGTVSVINTATCNAEASGGCSGPLPTVSLGPEAGPDSIAIDQLSDTVYIPIFGPSLGSLALLNGATCNAEVVSGCDQSPRTTPIGSSPDWITEDPVTRTVYSLNQDDSNLSVINAATCNARDSAGCREVPPALAFGFNGGGVVVDPSTDTVYATSQNNNTVTVLNGATCNGTVTFGCDAYAPTTPVGNGAQPIVVDPGDHTAYVGNQDDNTISVINTAECDIAHLSGCSHVWPTINIGFSDYFGLALNAATHTLYASNLGGNTLAVIDASACNAMITAGCSQTPETVTVGNGAAGIAIDQATDTVYVADVDDDTVSVVNGAICNATITSGCDQAAPTIATGNGPVPVALDPATRTLYVGNLYDDTVTAINTAACNAQTTSGCGQTAPSVTINDSPFGLAVDQFNDTVYATNSGVEQFDTGYSSVTSSVSVINGATCNGTVTTGCSNTPTSVPVGGLPWGVSVDETTQAVYVSSIVDSDVARIDAATCNGTSTADCHTSVFSELTGGWPSDFGVDDANGTLYVTNNVDADVSLYPLH